MEFCGNCGAKLNSGAKFCPMCGKIIEENTESLQQENQQQFALNEEVEEEFKLWQKIVAVLVWPAGIIGCIILFIRNKRTMAKTSLIYGIIGVVLTIALRSILGEVANSNIGGSTNSDLEKTTKELIIDDFKKRGSTCVIKDISLVHKSGNEYTGLAECVVDGVAAQYSLKVTYDGTTVLAEWELSDIRDNSDGGSVDDSEGMVSSVPTSNTNEAADVGYKAGYEQGFGMSGLEEDCPSDIMETFINASYSALYDAPSTPVEKEFYRIFKENFKKGFREGKQATN